MAELITFLQILLKFLGANNMEILYLTVGCVNYDCNINFYEPLKSLFGDVIYHNYLERIQQIGKSAMNNEIIDIVKKEKPEYVFFHTYQNQIKDNTLDKIGKLGSKVVAWFTDDHWRFDNYSRFVAKHVFCAITTDRDAYKKYRNLGINVIRSQWASNPHYYKRIPTDFKYDVSFVGQNYGNRANFLKFLKNKGIRLKVFGKGFGDYLEFNNIIKIFNESKINLNLSGSSANNRIKQIKGRIFEVPMCGGFLLTEYVEGIEEYFHIGKEIECFKDKYEAIDKINYYLKNEEKRIKIAEAGYITSHEKHTWEKRLRNVFIELNKIDYTKKKQKLISMLKDKIIEIKMRDRWGEKIMIKFKSYISLIFHPSKIIYKLFNRIKILKENIFLNNVYRKYINNNTRVERILKLKIDDSLKELIGERDLPANEKFQENAWYQKMLLRYGLAMHYSKGKNVLETCSGLGWGAYLLDGVARSITCVEIDRKSINLSKQLWKTDKTEYINDSVLKIPTEDNKYDIVTAMESIEHFKIEDIKTYLGEMYRVLKPRGFLIGSSAFPNTREEADTLCSKNKYHLHVCTRQEIRKLLRKQGFKKIKIFQNRLFFVAKK